MSSNCGTLSGLSRLAAGAGQNLGKELMADWIQETLSQSKFSVCREFMSHSVMFPFLVLPHSEVLPLARHRPRFRTRLKSAPLLLWPARRYGAGRLLYLHINLQVLAGSILEGVFVMCF